MKFARLKLRTPLVGIQSLVPVEDLPSPESLVKDFESTDKRPHFGKHEVDTAAFNLLRFLAKKKRGWSGFKLEEYLAWHKEHSAGCPPLFGLIGGWIDDGSPSGAVVTHTNLFWWQTLMEVGVSQNSLLCVVWAGRSSNGSLTRFNSKAAPEGAAFFLLYCLLFTDY